MAAGALLVGCVLSLIMFVRLIYALLLVGRSYQVFARFPVLILLCLTCVVSFALVFAYAVPTLREADAS